MVMCWRASAHREYAQSADIALDSIVHELPDQLQVVDQSFEGRVLPVCPRKDREGGFAGVQMPGEVRRRATESGVLTNRLACCFPLSDDATALARQRGT